MGVQDQKYHFEIVILTTALKEEPQFQKEIIILDKSGKDIDSEGFSKILEKKMNRRYKEIIFFIGGPNGIHSSIIKSNLSLSFGNQTWPHLLVRVMLIEQIYRALAILQGHPYHK